MDIKTSFISYICNQITNIEVKMVLEIRLSNMFSFRDEVTLDLQAAKIQTKKARELEGNLFSVDGEQMLKSVALFGANASGKSNVIKAIRACVNMVRSSHNYNVDTRFAIIHEGKMFLVDEIDNSLHTQLVEFVIGMFNHSDHAQLIYTTHNTHLLNTDFQRRDQVYFVNKREDGSSDLYSLFDFKDFRDTLDMEKAYLQGRFDAIPTISNLTI